MRRSRSADEIAKKVAQLQAASAAGLTLLSQQVANLAAEVAGNAITVNVQEVPVPRVMIGGTETVSASWQNPFSTTGYQMIPVVGSTLVGRLAVTGAVKSKTGVQVSVANVGASVISVNTGAVYLIAIEQP